jgi:hypothetical protein
VTKVGVSVVSLVIGAALAVSVLYAFRPKPVPKKDHYKNEYAVIAVQDKNNQCMVKEKRPQDIYTEPGSSVTWIIMGSCSGSPAIEIDRTFVDVDGSGTIDLFTPGDLSTTAQNGNTIVGHLKSDLAKTKANYEYTILINKKPAEYDSPADRGNFGVCPTWPC